MARRTPVRSARTPRPGQAKAKAKTRAPRATGIQLGEGAARGMVLLGAARVFAERGVRAASVEHLLAASNVSRRTFYRFFTSKEDVALALYQMGTERLVEGCRLAVAQTQDPLEQVQRFVEAHLLTARQLPRLVFVLGGEASRQESPLHARRMQAHASLVELLVAASPDVDPMLIRGVLLALEGITRLMLEECDEGRAVTDAAVARVRRVMLRVATATMAGEGARVVALPRRPERGV